MQYDILVPGLFAGELFNLKSHQHFLFLESEMVSH